MKEDTDRSLTDTVWNLQKIQWLLSDQQSVPTLQGCERASWTLAKTVIWHAQDMKKPKAEKDKEKTKEEKTARVRDKENNKSIYINLRSWFKVMWGKRCLCLCSFYLSLGHFTTELLFVSKCGRVIGHSLYLLLSSLILFSMVHIKTSPWLNMKRRTFLQLISPWWLVRPLRLIKYFMIF